MYVIKGGTSWGHKSYTWILLWAEKSAGPQSGQIFRRIPEKKRRRREKTSGSKILKNRDDKRLGHTQGNRLCATNSFSGAHSFHSPALEPSRSHCPCPSSEWPKSRTITKCKQLCPSKDFQEETKEYVARNPSFPATVSLKFFVAKWVALHVFL